MIFTFRVAKVLMGVWEDTVSIAAATPSYQCPLSKQEYITQVSCRFRLVEVSIIYPFPCLVRDQSVRLESLESNRIEPNRTEPILTLRKKEDRIVADMKNRFAPLASISLTNSKFCRIPISSNSLSSFSYERLRVCHLKLLKSNSLPSPYVA